MQERWQIIDELPNYSVSDWGQIVNNQTGRLIRQTAANRYFSVSLMNGGQSFTRRVHRLVGLAFCYGYAEGLEINHLDDNKLNNYYQNLEWTTHQENIKHAFKIGLSVSGQRTPIRIVETGEVFESQTACARAIGGYQSSINAVLKGQQTHHLGYTFEYI